MINKLQIGTSRLENLNEVSLKVFLDKSWLHLGDSKNESSLKENLFFYLKNYGFKYVLKRISGNLFRRKNKKNIPLIPVEELYKKTNFQEFFWNKSDSLPLEDNSIDFIFSEHFFEHLFFDEAAALFKECYRVLKPNGVIRVVVPDADLRVYESPEPIGFPSKKLSYTHPDKHKTRWSVYLLSEVLNIVGFKCVPLRYCDKSGKYNITSIGNEKLYLGSYEKELLLKMDYVQRIDSLIVDGIK